MEELVSEKGGTGKSGRPSCRIYVSEKSGWPECNRTEPQQDLRV